MRRVYALIIGLVVATIPVLGVAATETAAHADPQACDKGNVYGAFHDTYNRVGRLLSGSQSFFAYNEAGIDLQVTNSEDSDWGIYLLIDPNGRIQNGAFPDGTDPVPGPYWGNGGLPPMSSVYQTSTPPSYKVYQSSQIGADTGSNKITIHQANSADASQHFWFPWSGFSSTPSGALTHTPKRKLIGVGAVYLPEFYGADQVRIPNWPSVYPEISYRGYVGVNDPSRCAFYYGAKIWDNIYTDIDTPGGDVDTTLNSEGCPNNRRTDFLQNWNADVLMGSLHTLRLSAVTDYTWCQPNQTQNLGKIKVRSVEFCWTFVEGDAGDLNNFSGVEFEPIWYNGNSKFIDPPSTFVVPEAGSNLQNCSGTIPMEGSWSNQGGLYWWLMSSDPGWSIGANVLQNQDPPFHVVFTKEGNYFRPFLPNEDTPASDPPFWYRTKHHKKH